jgi:hypothetical protein
MAPHNSTVRYELCSNTLLALEQESDRMLELIWEIDQMLGEKEQRLKRERQTTIRVPTSRILMDRGLDTLLSI